MAFFKSIVRTIGKGASSAVGAVSSGAREVSSAVRKVPVVGKGLGAVVSLQAAPIHLAASVAKGDRIDKAVLNNLKQQVRDVKDVAPYAQMVLSYVPGVGTGVSAALSAGVALADGQPITAALVAGVRGAIPGGPAATAAFDISTSALQGKSVSEIAIKALPLPDEQKKAVAGIVQTAQRVARGERIDTAAARVALGKLPESLRKSVTAGIAIGNGITTQKKRKGSVTPKLLNELAAKGKKAKAVEISTIKSPQMKSGYAVGVTVAKTGTTPAMLQAIASKMKVDQRKGFELALAEQVGSVTTEVPDSIKGDAKATFAYRVTKGAETMSKKAQAGIVGAMAQNPALRKGVVAAVEDKSLSAKFIKVVIRVLKVFEK